MLDRSLHVFIIPGGLLSTRGQALKLQLLQISKFPAKIHYAPDGMSHRLSRLQHSYQRFVDRLPAMLPNAARAFDTQGPDL